MREGTRTNRDSEREIDEFVPTREVMIHHCMVELSGVIVAGREE